MTHPHKKDDLKELPQNEMPQKEDSSSSKPDLNAELIAEDTTEISSQPTPQEEVKLLKDQLLRSLAEAENIRKRAQREKEDTARFAIANFARDLLAVADNLTRALENLPAEEVEESDVIKSIHEGVKITERELNNVLERYGVKKISPLGEQFDHNFHQAMFEEESSDYETGKVCRVLQTGYVLHDRLLRPALVGVAKAKASS